MLKKAFPFQFIVAICMVTNELRKDYLLNRWVVFATKRKYRPTDFAKKTSMEQREHACPLCPGCEDKTPPAVLVYLPSGNGVVRKDWDRNGVRHKNWLVRCVPNLYPAFSPPTENEDIQVQEASAVAKAIGYHEVLVESPKHTEHPGVARISQLVHVIHAYLDRLQSLSAEPFVKYVSIFRNHGLEAGASLSHAHTQIIALPFTPVIVDNELRESSRYWTEKESCVFCDIVKKEKAGSRFVWENDSFVVFAPWASVHPFEFWIFPKKHELTPLEMSNREIEFFARTLRVSLGGLRSLLNDPPYNFGFHIAPVGERLGRYHWHLEVYPRLAVWAGFEKSTGMFINVVKPEAAAVELRKSVLAEEENL
jgi:UDPglucose--hexose-1-phosphate uridylyltransferase